MGWENWRTKELLAFNNLNVAQFLKHGQSLDNVVVSVLYGCDVKKDGDL